MIILFVLGLWAHLHVQGNAEAAVGATIPFEQLSTAATYFSDSRLESYKSFLIDLVYRQILIGTKGHLARLTLNLELAEDWGIWPEEEAMEKCQSTVPEDCGNYILVMLLQVKPNGRFVYACGTNYQSPKCYARDSRELATAAKGHEFPGEHKVPKIPQHQGVLSTLHTSEDLLFLGAAMDSKPGSSVIAVSSASDNSTFKAKEMNMGSAVFAGAFSAHGLVYFAFSEDAEEQPKGPDGKFVVTSRLGRVCASGDDGKDGFVSYTKASLRCGDYNIVRGVHLVQAESDSILFASFSNSNGKSAICQYNFEKILEAFARNFTCQTEVCPPRPLGPQNDKTCYGERNPEDIKDRIVLATPIEPQCSKAIFETKEDVSFGLLHVIRAIDQIHLFKAYVGDDKKGTVWNVDIGDCDKGAAVGVIWEVTSNENRQVSPIIQNITTAKDSVFVLTCCGVWKIPITNIQTTERIPEHSEFVSTMPPADGPMPDSRNERPEGDVIIVVTTTPPPPNIGARTTGSCVLSMTSAMMTVRSLIRYG